MYRYIQYWFRSCIWTCYFNTSSPVTGSRGYRTELGLSAGPAPLLMRSRPSWHPARAGSIGGPAMHDIISSRQSRWAAVGPLLNRIVACSPSTGGAAAGLVPGHHRLGCCRPGRRGGPGTRGAGLEVITVRVHSGHDSFPLRAESARPMSAEQRV
jgi:hypothetical protein